MGVLKVDRSAQREHGPARGAGDTSTPEANKQLPRHTPRQAALVRDGGRVAVVVIPVAIIASASTHEPVLRQIAVGCVLCAVWLVCLWVGQSLGGVGLTALGPRVGPARAVLLGVVATTVLDAWLPWFAIPVQATFFTAAVVFVLAAIWEDIALRRITPAKRLLIVGSGPSVIDLTRDIRVGQGGGYEVVGIVHDADEQALYGGVPVLGRMSALGEVITEHRPDIVVLAPGPDRPQTFGRLLEAAEAGFRVVELAQFYEHAYGRVPVRDLTRAWFMSVLHLYQRPYSHVAKRTVDLIGACVLLVVTLPLLPVLALLVRQTPGPAILRQLRLGEHGVIFTIYKFRTMYDDAEVPGHAVWSQTNDPRITPAGQIMRRLRLDELPQLWNVVRGDMSLVGPRPERPEFLAELNETVPFWTRRHLVKPGLTGWAQVRQGYTASADATSDKLSYDLWYIRHRSLTVDIAICLRTISVVLGGDQRARPPAKQETLFAVDPVQPADPDSA
jgi:exopolysaccharide biosynthesis polyprenyl glycosylphosphotransferase